MELGGTGIWSGQLRFGDPAAIRDASAELESLGYSALWIPGGVGGAVFDDCETILTATEHVVVATGILNLWMHTAHETADGHAHLTDAHPGRFLLGIGVSHPALVDRDDETRYARPLLAMQAFLDGLDTAPRPVPSAERVLAALGPKMLGLSRDRAAGAHPYLVTPEHTRFAREVLGDGPLLAPEQHAVLETDPAKAREIARQALAIYMNFPNYVNNWRRLGFTEDDVADGGSDRLVDGIVAWGDEAAIAARVQEHRDAGADHVCVQLSTADGVMDAMPLTGWRALAPALVG
jgi:probable F420-dependent oxidoreductase